jgi:hypothetical protein
VRGHVRNSAAAVAAVMNFCCCRAASFQTFFKRPKKAFFQRAVDQVQLAPLWFSWD